jgi:hypothetical protein
MGVHGLWTLLEPVGRRIDIQAISNKRLAVGEYHSSTALAVLSSCSCELHLSTAQRPFVAWVSQGLIGSQVATSQVRDDHTLHALYFSNGCCDPACCCCGGADASIWLYQFIRAMRTPDGEMMKNAHLLGFFRRICK